MIVTSKISVDLTRPNMGGRVNAVQGDGNTRTVDITLLADGKPWTPPGDVEAAIAYKQPGGTKGLYNKLADGTAAISISGNVATVILAPQMLTVSGTVQASLVFNDAQLNRLTTFPFAVSVTSNPAAGAQKVEDYIRLQWLEDKLDEYVKKITDGLTPGGSGAVSSVNGKTGAVELSAKDVHAMPDDTVIPTVPEKVSAFENDVGYLTKHQDISGKVDKVDGKELSTHDYDDAAKEKVDAIPENPKYTDTVTLVDATLKNEGEAADAKATGSALSQLKDDLANKVPKKDYAPEAKTDSMTQPVGKDENGKLWTSPASGGSGIELPDNFSLIFSEVVSEQVDQIIIKTDSNGDALSLKAAFVEVKIGVSDSEGIIMVALHNSASYGIISYSGGINLSTSKEQYFSSLCRAHGEKIFSVINTNLGNVATEYYNKTVSGAIVRKNGGESEIKQIVLSKFTASIPAGTEINVYGVRA